jgi:hypothetical protein
VRLLLVEGCIAVGGPIEQNGTSEHVRPDCNDQVVGVKIWGGRQWFCGYVYGVLIAPDVMLQTKRVCWPSKARSCTRRKL